MERKSGPIAWMAGNSVAANLAMLLFLVGGLFFATTIKKEVFPAFELDRITVSVAYPGASPEEVENGIVLAVEERVRGMEGVKNVFSSSNEGRALIRIELYEGHNNEKLYQDIKQEIDRIPTFPKDAEKPEITLVSRRRHVISLILYGDYSDSVMYNSAETVREMLLENKNIDQVEIEGVKSPEISINVSEENLRKHGLTLRKIANILKNNSVEIPGGAIDTGQGDILLRIKQRKNYGYQFATIPIISGKNGSRVLLEDIAQINDGFEDSDEFDTFNGLPATNIDIYRVGDQTPDQVASAAKNALEKIGKYLPPGMNVEVRNDRSKIYRQRMELLLRNAYIGMVLVFFLLGLFLDARLALWVTLGIPTSFLGAFLFLPSFAVSINMVSMFAFIIAIGIVVDDAIVVGEVVYEKRLEGLKPLEAAISGAKEVALPVTFSILTNIVTFAPLLFVPGTVGKIFKQIPIVVIVVFTISLIEALFVLPSHLSHKVKNRGKLENWIHSKQQKFSIFFMAFVKRRYSPFLRMVIKNRYLSISIAIAVLIIALGYIKVLDTANNVYQIKRSVLSAEKDLLLNRVHLYKSLAGGFEMKRDGESNEK